ncbi:chaperone NapD [Shewanella khirikhana]|jgi:nitrate reductase NapD|uniref:Chaperone NapD n=1 Tax=Shewanella khirikhana TaxID=1965282 RepID=A0ABN5TX03_9GAMM|nr:chaperone NapD [Shewanella khirikhana]AZQ11959.1 assembly protein for periplasmic nitrate reductase [Shewanella khirikhana]
MTQEYHVTSLVVHAAPSQANTIARAIEILPGAEVHATSPEGKLVVTLEGSTQRAILDNVEAINALNGVLSSSLIYHQSEQEQQVSEETP